MCHHRIAAFGNRTVNRSEPDPEAFAWTPVLCLNRGRGYILPAHGRRPATQAHVHRGASIVRTGDTRASRSSDRRRGWTHGPSNAPTHRAGPLARLRYRIRRARRGVGAPGRVSTSRRDRSPERGSSPSADKNLPVEATARASPPDFTPRPFASERYRPSRGAAGVPSELSSGTRLVGGVSGSSGAVCSHLWLAVFA
jgi:hypothetical protein